MSIKDLVLKIAKTKKHKFNLLGNCPHCDRPFIVKNSPIIKQKIVKKRGLGTRLGWMNAKDILELKKLGFGERKIARVTGWSFYTIRDVIANPLPYKLKK